MIEHSDFRLTYSTLTAIARGYADAIVETMGCSDVEQQWEDIGVDDFAPETLRTIEAECDSFYGKAIEIAGNENALLLEIDEYDLGRHLFLARQGTGVGFEEFLLEKPLDRLVATAETFGWIEVEISDDRKIVFLFPDPNPASAGASA